MSDDRMSDDPRTERLVSEWLDDMRHPRPPDYVVDAVLSSLPSTRQDSTNPWRVAIRRFGRAGLAAAAAVAVGVLALAVLVRPEAPVQPGASPSDSPTPSSQAGAPSLPPGVTAIDMGTETWSLTVDDASVWVQNQDNVIRRIDRATNTVGSRVPRDVPHMQLENGQLWALSGGTEIIRVDPLTGHVLQEFTGVSGFNIAVDGTTAWVSDAGHTVDRVDLETGEIVASVDVPAGPRELIVFEGDVWVACDEGGVVARIDGVPRMDPGLPGGINAAHPCQLPWDTKCASAGGGSKHRSARRESMFGPAIAPAVTLPKPGRIAPEPLRESGGPQPVLPQLAGDAPSPEPGPITPDRQRDRPG
jgi:hypothetical protein